MTTIFKVPSKIRKGGQRGKEVTIPPYSKLSPRDSVIIYCWGSIVLIVPVNVKVNEELIKVAITDGQERAKD